MTAITVDYVRALLDYNPDTGVFTWRQARGGVMAGSVAGTLHSSGVVVISMAKKLVKAHRLAWLYVNGSMPANQIDHINGVRSDNRICNLREATSAQNQQNRKRANKNSASGLLGVSWDSHRGKWQARIKLDGRQLFVGRFDDAKQAHQAYLEAKAKLHPFQTIAEKP